MLTQAVERSRVGLLVSPFVFKTFLFILFLLAWGPDVIAQSVDGRPVSTLITAAPRYTRPRRVASVSETPASSFSSALSEANDIERRAFEQTNLAREQNGLPRFEWDSDL